MLYGLCMAVLALQLTAVCTDNWSVKSSEKIQDINVQSNLGLWKACGDIWGNTMINLIKLLLI